MEIHIVLDNIRSCFNVGSIFRSADGVGCVKKIYLCGITADVGNPKLEKTALGATHMVPSQHYDTTQEALEEIRKQNIPIYSVEISKGAENFQKIKYPQVVAFIFGHEKTGIGKDILQNSDKIICIPMRGKKESLNVANCATAILYEATRNVD